VKSRVNTLMQPNLSITDLRLLPVPLPALSEQQALLKALQRFSEDFQKLDSVYMRKLAALDELKQSILHQAFSGGLPPQSGRQPHGRGLQMCTQ
jgi:type I restriction enzyme, S subunit